MIHRKTTKGQTEIESGSRALPQRLRMVLLLVDGQREDAELVAMLATATPGALSELKALGYIEERPLPTAPIPGTIAAIGTVLPTSRHANGQSMLGSRHESRYGSRHESRMDSRQHARLEAIRNDPRFAASQAPVRTTVHHPDTAITPQQREQIVRSVQRALGPTAKALVMRIEQARTLRDMQMVLDNAHRAIANARGQDMADEFASRYGNLEAH